MNYTRKRWLILVVCCLANLCLGSIYTWSVFASPMADYLTGLTGATLTTADLAIVYTIANSVGPITMISGGWFNDRLGPRAVLLVGGVMWGMGMVLSGFATSVGALIVTYGLVGGLGLGMAYGATVSSCIKFFPDKRGLIGGITTAVYGLGSVVLPPVVTALVQAYDAPTAFKIVGTVFTVVLVVAALLMVRCPDGFVPDGWTPPAQSVKATAVNLDWKHMLTTPIFYVMAVLLCCGAFCGMMITSQASAIGQNMVGLSAMAASTAVSVLSLFNVFGRIAAGFLSDKIGRINTLTLSCLLAAVGLLCLYYSSPEAVVLFYVGSSVVGLCFGSFMGVYPGFTADQFGPKNNSVNYGIMFIGFAVAGYFGPSIMRSVLQADGTYHRAFLIACGLSIAGVITTFVYRLVSKKTR
ncbi:OFA family MFS transporter [Pseudoflavonifractor sp. An85]|uniref:L-lactate MFS transporter n=1 Tax=Pseudoflavonifractor sp. An85 TaxID=1965661 RepID=UPI000B381D0D|nr:OFA family MFS transporter [Pseudoflavonifractor sp. An85]OUN23508.1 MFS transporter [Pseudoflavonifractor sp. An85]